MKRKFFLGALLTILISSVGFAQSNLGVVYFLTQNHEAAKNYFETQLAESPTAEAYYYLGELAYLGKDEATAKSYYEKGLALDPDFMLNNVGLGRLLLKTDMKTAESYFSTAIKKNKKDVRVILAAAYAYAENGMFDKALEKINEAKKIDKKSPYVYIAEGDIAFMKKDINNAASQYQQAIYFDPNNIIARIRIAHIYENTGAAGTETAIEELEKVLTIAPDFMPAYRALGRIYYSAGAYAKAIEVYSQYFNSGITLTAEDYINYAGALFFTANFNESKVILERGLAKFPNDFVLNRLLMYIHSATKNYEEGLAVGQKFFSLDKGKATYLTNDYLQYGKILAENDQEDKAIEQYRKAIALDPENALLYKEVADAWSSVGNSGEAAAYFKKYIELTPEENVQSIDYYNLGRYYYMSGRAAVAMKPTVDPTTGDSILVDPATIEVGKAELQEAIKAFGKVAEMASDTYLGFLWRARAYSALDLSSEKGLARPYYEETEKVILASNQGIDPTSPDFKNKNELKEVYGYMSYYYFLQYEKSKSAQDKANIKLYSEKLQALDPGNKQAQQLLDYIK